MKNIILSTAITLLGYYSYAQTNVINSTGNVGIGTTNPGSLLNVVGGGTTMGANVPANTADGGLSIGNIATSYTPNFTNWTTTGTTLLLSAQPYSVIGFHHAGVRVDFIRAGNGTIQIGYDGGWGQANVGLPNGIWNSSGNVGIGTTSPATTLDVNGTGNFSANLSTGSMAAATNVFQQVLTNSYYGISGVSYPGQFRWYASPNNSLYKNNALYQLRAWDAGTQTEGTVLTITGGGNLGIGTMSPDQMLTVNGTIHARQVNVDLNIQASDFVFDRNYKLRSLAEVNRYITLNKHLPEIPSGKSMEKNGVNVNEFNMKMLQKVEELTLYLIDKHKQLKEQQAQIDQLKKQMEQLIRK